MDHLLPFLALVSLAFAPGQEPRPDPANDSLKNLEGAWSATTVEKTGMKVEGATIQVVFKGDTLKLFEDGKRIATATIRLQVEGQSRLIDLSFSEGSVQGMTFEGIYDLNGDALKICFALKQKERPTAFVSTRESQSVLLVLARDKP